MLLWLILSYRYLCKINLSYLFLKKCIYWRHFYRWQNTPFSFIIFVACLVCFNSIFTTYAIFPYIRSLLCIIWWKIFCNKCLWFCRAIILLLRIKQLLYLGLLSLQFFTVRIIESTCSQVCDIFIEKMVLGLKTAASPFILNILINAKDFFFQNR